MGPRLENAPAAVYTDLQAACKRSLGLDRYYLPLAIFLSAETGLRLSELLALTWQNIDLDARRIDIPPTLDGLIHLAPRPIVIPYMSKHYLTGVAMSLLWDERFHQSDRLIPMTVSEFQEAWSDVVERASIHGLRFGALRQAASFRFYRAGLTEAEQRYTLGCCETQMDEVASHLETVQDKLDRYFFDGRTADEAKGKVPLIEPEKVIELRELLASMGVVEIEQPDRDVIRHFPPVVLRPLAYY